MGLWVPFVQSSSRPFRSSQCFHAAFHFQRQGCRVARRFSFSKLRSEKSTYWFRGIPKDGRLAGQLHHFCRAKLVDTLRVWKRKQLTEEALRSRDIQRPPVASFKLDDLISCSDTCVVGPNINPLLAMFKDYQSLGVLGYLSFRVIVVSCDSLRQNIFARSCKMQGFGAKKLTK